MVPRPVATPSPPWSFSSQRPRHSVLRCPSSSSSRPMTMLFDVHAPRCPPSRSWCSVPAFGLPLGPLPTAPAWQYRVRRGAPVLIAVHQSRQVAFLEVPEYLGLPDYVLGHLRAIFGHFPRKARPGAAPGTSQGRRPAMQGPYWALIPHRSARRPERHEATAPLPPLFNTLRP